VENELISQLKKLLIKYKRFIRFGIVGVINTLVTISINSLCNNVFLLEYRLSWVIGFAGGVTNSYIMNKFWTFESKGKSASKTTKEMIQFFTVSLVSLGATTLGLTYFVENMRINENIAQFPTIVISQFINYFGYKLWVFKK